MSLFRTIASHVPAKGMASHQLSRATVKHAFDRCQTRWIGSVVAADDISVPEFDVKNEPILGECLVVGHEKLVKPVAKLRSIF